MPHKFAACLLLCTIGLLSQTRQTGEVSGKVTSSSGAGIANATVTFKDSSTGATRQTTTGTDGAFVLRDIPPGSYQVELTNAGKLETTNQPVRIEAGGGAAIALTFASTATTTEGVVEVEGYSPTLQTESAEVSRAYGTVLVRQLPVQDRQAQELVALMPGITPPVMSSDRVLDPQRRREMNVNGLPAYANAYHQDGAYQTDLFTSNIVRIQPNESVQSLDVRTSNYNAEYGSSAGAWTNTVTRPGQNAVHGSLFAFHTNNWLETRNPLNNQGDAVSPRFNRNQFGASLGGPVVSDRLFVFGAYEGFLQRGRQFEVLTVPTEALRAGNFSGLGTTVYDPRSGTSTGANRTPLLNGQLPQSQINPFSRGLLNFVPLPNRPGLVNNLAGAPLLIDDNHRGDLKIDHRLSERAYGFFRYGFTHGSVERSSLLGAAGDGATGALRNHNGVASISYNVSPNLTGEFRGGYSRYRNEINPLAAGNTAFNDFIGASQFSGGVPSIQISGFSPLGFPAAFPAKPINNVFDGATNWNWRTGMHNLKFGLLGRVIRASGFDMSGLGSRGGFQFGSGAASLNSPTAVNGGSAAAFASFLTGLPSQAGVSSFATTPTFQQEHYGAHITDTITLFQKLNLEFGLRYEVFSPVRTRFTNNNQIFDPSTGQVQNALVNARYDTNNVAPRVGIAFQPVQRLVFRAGYGIHYFPLPFALAGLNQQSLAAQNGFGGGFTGVGFQLPTVGNGQNPNGFAPNQPFVVLDRGRRTPYVQTVSAMIQGDLGQGFLLDLAYVGNVGRQLPIAAELNASQPGAGALGLPFTSFGRTASTTDLRSGANSNYNSMQVNLTKRFAKAFALTGAYTWSKALDTGLALSLPFDRGANYGPADWDRTHMLSMSHVWRLPFGQGNRYFASGALASILGDWELNGILRWATAAPYSITLDPLSCNCLNVGGLRAAGGNFDVISGQTSFDPSQFTLSTNQLSNIGRNAYRGPEFFTYDAALYKNFAVRENWKLEMRAELYNATNNANYMNPVSSSLLAGYGSSNRLFNAMGGRRFQLAARLLF